tara:strand:- start:2522 stop:2767 length:246 start_codon:yes stop_codon:yes gene_type:complete
MEYQLKLNKPSSLRGSDHGKIQALTDMYDFIINTPTGDLNHNLIREEIQKRLYKLGCNNLSVSSESLTRNFNNAFGGSSAK